MKAKRIIIYSVVLAILVAAFAFCALNADAAEETSGTCGENLTWSYNPQTATLTIEGAGEMNSGAYPWSVYAKEVKHIILPEGLLNISSEAFRNFLVLEDINIPTTVTFIDSRSFQNCRELKSIVIPSKVDEMGYSVFENCVSLESVTIEAGDLWTLPHATFKECRKLVNVSLPDTLSLIENSAFENCLSLESIRLPKEHQNLVNNFLLGCESLKRVYEDSDSCVLRFSVYDDREFITSLNLEYIFFSADSLKNYPCIPTEGDKIVSEVVNGVLYYGYPPLEWDSVVLHTFEKYVREDQTHKSICTVCGYESDPAEHDYSYNSETIEREDYTLTNRYCVCGAFTQTTEKHLFDDDFITVLVIIVCGALLFDVVNAILVVIIIRAIIKKKRKKNNEKTSE
ncbi:MAG: leucine-rich repeat domain-containing protein [Ruminococcaceae bacterium]|nr:leucine-rich repeat domain-containing protein [Oscillospiraceae bacterium]